MFTPIKIREPHRPFSHRPGTLCVLPKTDITLRIFPTRVYLFSEEKTFEWIWDWEGPVENFTIVQDLEKGCIEVFGSASKGYFRYRIFSYEKIIFLSLLRFEKNEISSLFQKKQVSIEKKKPFSLFSHSSIGEKTKEKLSLGSHKSQDWDLVLRRKEIKEIFPLWLSLGNQTPSFKEDLPLPGLLLKCEKALENKETPLFLSQMNLIFQAGFSGLFSPCVEDEKHQGINLLWEREKIEPSLLSTLSFSLLTKGAQLIRSLFIRTEKNHLYILPHLPKQFVSGRFIQIDTPYGKIDLEWTKGKVRKMKISAEVSQEIICYFQDIRSFRLREDPKRGGSYLLAKKPLCLEKGKVYYLDRFEK